MGGTIIGGDGVLVRVGSMDNAGQVQAQGGSLTVEATGGLSNRGTMSSVTSAELAVDGPIVNSGELLAQQALVLAGLTGRHAGAMSNEAGGVIASGSGSYAVGSLSNAGRLSAHGTTLTADVIGDVTNAGRLSAASDVEVMLGGDLTNSGTLSAVGQMRLGGRAGGRLGVLSTTAGSTTNGGVGLWIAARSLSNAGSSGSAGGAVEVELSEELVNAGLLHSGAGSYYRVGGTISNSGGQISSEEGLRIEGLNGERAGALRNASGRIAAAAGELRVRAASVSNERAEGAGSGGQLQSGEAAWIETGELINRDSRIAAVDSLRIEAGEVSNLQVAAVAEIESGGLLLMTVGGGVSNSGTLSSLSSADLNVDGAMDNSGQMLVAEALTVGGWSGTHGGALTNRAGGVISSSSGSYWIASLDNAGELSGHGSTLSIDVSGNLSNAGSMSAKSDLTVELGGALSNSGTLRSEGQMTLDGRDGARMGELTVSGDGVINGGTGLSIKAASLTNGGQMGSTEGELSVELSGDLTNSGLLYSGAGSHYRLEGSFTNQENADVIAEQSLTIEGLQTGTRAGALTNTSGRIEAVTGQLVLRAASVTNERARLEILTEKPRVQVDQEVVEETATLFYYPICLTDHPGTGWYCGYIKRVKTTYEVTNTESVGEESTEAQLLAGGSMTIETEELTNHYSQIEASGDITIKADRSATNVGRNVETTTWTEVDRDYVDQWCQVVAYCPDEEEHRWSDDPVVEGESQPTIDRRIHGTIRAGGTVSFTIAAVDGYLENNAIKSGHAAQIPEAEDPLNEVEVQEGATPQMEGLAETEGLGDPQAPEAPVVVPIEQLEVSIDALLGRRALFERRHEPDMPYLLETRSEFIDLSKYLGSDYFLERVGLLAGDLILKRLGDAYVETRLIERQIFDLTGRRYLEAGLDFRSQMRSLYDGAVAANESLQLTIGVALSAEQVAALSADIIWLERHVVAGQEVLVPRLYLSSATREGVDLASAQISGSRTIIEAATVVNAGGTIEGSEELAIETTEDLLNEGGSLVSGGDIDLEVGGQFANRDGVVSGGGEVEIEAEELYSSGIISGTEGLSIEVEKDLENQGGSLLSEGDIDLEVGGQFANRDGVVSGGGKVEIEAEELYSSGIISGTEGLSIEVEKDLENEGGSLLSEGDIDLEAGGQFANRSGVVSGGGNVRIAAAEIINETLVIREELDGGFAERADRTATIQAGGALSLQATGSITSTGGALRSGEGMRLDAGGDIEIAALRLESQQTNRYWASTESSSSVTHQLAVVEAGGELRVDAGGDLTVRGAQVLAGGDARLFAVGDTTIASVQDEQRSSGLRGSETIQTQRTMITSGGELTIGSESGDVTLQAVTLRSGGDTILSAAEGTVSLLTETDEASQRFFDRTETLYTWSERRGGSYQETIEHVEMQQGGQLRIVAGAGVVAEREAGAPSQRPELAWMEQLADDPNVTWEEVQADSSSWSSTTRGLTAAGVAREEEQRREAAEAAARAAALRAASATEGGAGSPPAGGLPGAGEQYSLEDPANLPSFRVSITGSGDPGEQRPPGQEFKTSETSLTGDFSGSEQLPPLLGGTIGLPGGGTIIIPGGGSTSGNLPGDNSSNRTSTAAPERDKRQEESSRNGSTDRTDGNRSSGGFDLIEFFVDLFTGGTDEDLFTDIWADVLGGSDEGMRWVGEDLLGDATDAYGPYGGAHTGPDVLSWGTGDGGYESWEQYTGSDLPSFGELPEYSDGLELGNDVPRSIDNLPLDRMLCAQMPSQCPTPGPHALPTWEQGIYANQSAEGGEQGNNESTPTDGADGTSGNSIPQQATDTLNEVAQTGDPPAGYTGGEEFYNDGRQGGQVLPQTDSDGNPITYREYDVHLHQPGVNRGAERIVIGSDGNAYYTDDHYDTFTKIVR